MADSADSTHTPSGQALTPVVYARGGIVFANSRDVATYFGKRHDHLLRTIENLLAQAPELGLPKNGEGSLRSFADGMYTLPETGNQGHKQYVMDRDGFALLAMGFTGPKALRWKLRWIEAFNRMEAELRAAAERWPPSKPVTVEAHSRALPKRPRLAAPPQQPAALRLDRDGFALMRIGGEVLVVDLMHVEAGPGRRAVVIDWDDGMAVQDMTEATSHRRFLGARSFTVPHPTAKGGKRSFWAVGTVVAAQTLPVPDKVATSKVRPAKVPGRRDARPAMPPRAMPSAAEFATIRAAGHA